MCSPSQTWMTPLTMITALFINIAINRVTDTLIWVNPDFYDYYLVAPPGETPVEVIQHDAGHWETREDAPPSNRNLLRRAKELLLENATTRTWHYAPSA